MSQKVKWRGLSGKVYEYEVCEINGSWNEVPGNYIFAKIHNNQWHILYAGETGNLKNRLVTSHEKWHCGMTQIHVHVSSQNAEIRRAEEADIKKLYKL